MRQQQGLERGGLRRRRWLVVIGALLSPLVVLGEAPTAAAASGPVMSAAPSVYVALGDSYSSGEGVPPFADGGSPSQGRCHRSTRAYSRLLAAVPDLPEVRQSWACSGATIGNFYPGQGQYGEPGQLEHLGADDEVVTLTAGGNDLKFSTVLGVCLLHRACDRTWGVAAGRLLRQTEPRLGALYREVLIRAPRAQVFVVGYPRFLAVAPSPLCRLGGLEPRETRWLGQQAAVADAMFHRIVDGVADPRLHYVSVLDAFAGGEACASGRLVHGVVPRHPEYSFHPTAAGQAVLAREVAAAIARVATSPDAIGQQPAAEQASTSG